MTSLKSSGESEEEVSPSERLTRRIDSAASAASAASGKAEAASGKAEAASGKAEFGPILVFVMAHGAGSSQITEPELNFLSYNEFVGEREKKIAGYPKTLRLIKTGRSAVTDFNSDRRNVGEMIQFITNPEVGQRMKNNALLRRTSQHLGARDHYEIFESMQHYSSDEKIYNEMVEVEMVKNSSGDAVRIKSEKGDDDTGGFGIWIFDGIDWQYIKQLSENVLLEQHGDKQMKPKDVSILDIVQGITTWLGHDYVVVISPNCSPPTDAALTDTEERANYHRVTHGDVKIKQMPAMRQFLLGLDFAARTANMYEGMKSMYYHYYEDGVSAAAKTAPDVVSSHSSKKSTFGEDRIGIWDPPDLIAMVTQFGYLFKDYLKFHNPACNNKLIQHLMIFPYFQRLEGTLGKINAGRFLLMLLMLIFKIPEKYGGIMYEDDKALIKKFKEKGKEEEEETVTGSGRDKLWTMIEHKIISGQSARGRKHEIRPATSHNFKKAQSQLNILLDETKKTHNKFTNLESAGRLQNPTFLNFDDLCKEAHEFAIQTWDGGKKRKRKTRKRKRKTKRNSPHKKKKTRSKSSKRRKRKRRTKKGRRYGGKSTK